MADDESETKSEPKKEGLRKEAKIRKKPAEDRWHEEERDRWYEQVYSPRPVDLSRFLTTKPAATHVVSVDEVKAQISALTEAVKEAEAKGDPTIEVRVRSMAQDISLRKVVAYGSMVLFGLMNLGAIVLFYLNGFGVTALSDTALLGLLGATIAEVAGVMFIVARYLFPTVAVMTLPAPESGEGTVR